MAKKPISIGLTGGISSGKSKASEFFGRLYPIYDADVIVHELYAKDESLLQSIEDRFPGVLCNGALDKAKLRSQVFSDPERLKQLNRLVHPRVRKALEDGLKRQEELSEPAFFVIPLLFENGWQSQLDMTLLIGCEQKNQIQRLMKRDQCTKEHALDIIRAQMPLDEKIKLATHIIMNDGTLNEFYASLNLWLGERGLKTIESGESA